MQHQRSIAVDLCETSSCRRQPTATSGRWPFALRTLIDVSDVVSSTVGLSATMSRRRRWKRRHVTTRIGCTCAHGAGQPSAPMRWVRRNSCTS